MRKIAILGASALQVPLIEKAKSMGIETHVFAWASNDIGEKIADYFYPISTVEKEAILEECRRIGIDGICSIASDLAMITVNYVASELGLTGNTVEATIKSTNKHRMREAFLNNGDPSPKSVLVDKKSDLSTLSMTFPVIVKPTDRSGSRGIFKLNGPEGLERAVENAIKLSFEKKALVEEYVEGQEYSVEFISYAGKHQFIALTKKYTTGAPHFIETGHLEPASVGEDLLKEIKSVISHALDSLGLKYGASHSEIKVDAEGNIRLIEIGGRMGGGFIGSDLVALSTGFDFVEAVLKVSLGEEPDLHDIRPRGASAIRFILSEYDLEALDRLKKENFRLLVKEDIKAELNGPVTDDSNRHGFFIMRASTVEELMSYLPDPL